MKKPVKFYFLVACIISFSCTSPTNETQPLTNPGVKIISADTMKSFMKDLYLTESYIRWASSKGHDPTAVSIQFYHLLLEKYQLDTARINASINYYLTKEDQWIEMLTSILNEDFPDIDAKKNQVQPF